MFSLLYTLCVQVQNSTLSEKQAGQYLDIGTKYVLEIKVGQPQQYQIAASKYQLQIDATDFADVFMCVSSTLMEPETAVCELQITAKGQYDLSPGLKFVLLYSKVADKIVSFAINIKVSQLVHQEQTKITLLKDIFTFANAQVNLQSLNDYKQIVVQSTVSGLPPAEECKITYSVDNIAYELTDLSSFVSFTFLLQNVQGIQNFKVQVQSTCGVEIVMIYSLIYDLDHEVTATTSATAGTYFVKKNEPNTSQITIFESKSNHKVYVCSIPILLTFIVADCVLVDKEAQTAQLNIDSEKFKSTFVYYTVKSDRQEQLSVNSNTVQKLNLQELKNAQIEPSSSLYYLFTGNTSDQLQVEVSVGEGVLMCVQEHFSTNYKQCSLNITKSGTYNLNSEQKYLMVHSSASVPFMISVMFVVEIVKKSQSWIIWVVAVVVIAVISIALFTYLFVRNKKQSKIERELLTEDVK
ncbi:Hypothetical_protein [Hexamita inflata]|uniref:Hypothetical_protein n=1 Tax=Hexamita inflata TaxID=28002 RepID=A0AA86NVV1_9EUKA|nr:Hypothetical protein HINF_LOCUS3731 [Hexamita inflata]CAI9927151.1 Hypothetical protein HINF_LOCUS14796 [Hexamita inflata]CAI9927155.1 Hypothetical protein HINF_LOCUS14800 [Hexamita inflata]